MFIRKNKRKIHIIFIISVLKISREVWLTEDISRYNLVFICYDIFIIKNEILKTHTNLRKKFNSEPEKTTGPSGVEP